MQGKTLAQVQSAIASVSSMSGLSGLSVAQLTAIVNGQ
jgi:hypothetical protein